ncbi:MAG: shikimate kinase [Ruminococcus sp.]
MTVFLCGFMGCGKSTSGRLAAKKLGCNLVDTDELIVESEGMSIPEIFEQKGEPYFRKVESETVKSLCGRTVVAACGGGAMLNNETAAAANKNGLVIFLDVPFDTCYERIKGDANRPIAASSTREELLERYNSRREVYIKNSGVIIDASGTPVENAEKIAAAVRERNR